MSDRELLELAAKAAGYKVQSHPNRKLFKDIEFALNGNNWNPFTNDGDAFRLAVRLGLQIQPYPLYAEPKYAVLSHKGIIVDGEPKYTHGFSCVYEGDPEGATRRAIVLAAAEIGRGMP